MNILKLDSVDSTNTWVAENEDSIPAPSLVYCMEQKAGRGQRGNHWESEPGKNITASLIFRPDNFPAIHQFAISELIALSISDFLKNHGVETMVKWPNDIYVGDKKICGILVEHTVLGKYISRTIAGFGININQTEFVSDAPNPVSMSQLTGKTYDIDSMVAELSSQLDKRLNILFEMDTLHSDFLLRLWRGTGDFYDFLDHGRKEKIKAKIKTVHPTGILSLETIGGENREYAFKEVEFIL